MTVEQLANMVDHTNLKAFADDEAFTKLCDEARKYNFKMVAINPAQTVRCKEKLKDSLVHVGAAIGFPLGQKLPRIQLLLNILFHLKLSLNALRIRHDTLFQLRFQKG